MSNIDPTKPTEVQATTESVRDNFQSAADEIDANAAAIATNIIDISTNAAGISTNAADILTNASAITAQGAAAGVSYDNTTSGLTAADVQAAIDEVAAAGPGGGGSFVTIPQVETITGNNIDFLIPASVTKLQILLDHVGFAAASFMAIQLGTGVPPNGFEILDYDNVAGRFSTAAQNATAALVKNWLLPHELTDNQVSGILDMTLMDAATNKWLMSGTTFNSQVTTDSGVVSGTKSLASELTSVRLTSFNGGSTFNNGFAGIMYWLP